MNVEKISISLPRELAEKVEEYADETNQAKSQVVQKALDQYLKPKSEAEESEETLWEDKVLDKLNEIDERLTRLEEGKEEEPEDHEIKELLEDCDNLDDFKDRVKELEGDYWTDERLKECGSWLRDIKKKVPDESWEEEEEEEKVSKEDLEEISQLMKLNKAQKKTFNKAFESPDETEEETEEKDEWD